MHVLGTGYIELMRLRSPGVHKAVKNRSRSDLASRNWLINCVPFCAIALCFESSFEATVNNDTKGVSVLLLLCVTV